METFVEECRYDKPNIPFHVEAKVDIKPYASDVDSINLNQYLQYRAARFPPLRLNIYKENDDFLNIQNRK